MALLLWARPVFGLMLLAVVGFCAWSAFESERVRSRGRHIGPRGIR